MQDMQITVHLFDGHASTQHNKYI